MKADIHPKYEAIEATCSCGNVIQTRSTLCAGIHLDVCSACHPFYTGKQKIVDAGGRIDRFKQRFGAISSKK
ncbi:50S ribosomal protein L31 [Atopomonas sediminilitoris]|uniref:50S ribosomal protein L31 n=1 Tax=Atopomonas sediminilitoris TaxID=2919919 RepID=UPI001F4D5DAF|nr:50S ribosomal protein L31 [Atopomonas sediminilitoris]MCJ8170401.1 50S ribosomal protein L31 [Atopomonas sediminilitoris]